MWENVWGVRGRGICFGSTGQILKGVEAGDGEMRAMAVGVVGDAGFKVLWLEQEDFVFGVMARDRWKQ